MLRKTLLAIAATAAIGTAALAPTSASAHWGGGWHGGGWYGFHPFVSIGGPVYDGCTVQRWVHTRHGTELRWVNVCY